MIRAALAIACALPLVACNSEPEVSARNASPEEVANQLAEAGGSDSFVRAGKWRSEIRIEQLDMPGAPPEAASAMRGMTDKAQVHESCLTPEQVKRPKEDFFAGANKNCRYDHFNMGGGKIDAVMNCSGQGATHTMALEGTYGPDDYRMQMTMKANPPAGVAAGAMTMKMRVDAKRIGECDGKSA